MACGYQNARMVTKKGDLIRIMGLIKHERGPQMLIAKVKKGARKNLGRPTTTPIRNKETFIDFLKD